MGESKVREPIQQRSIEKKRRIMEAGFVLFCEKGYYKTNTAEIAKKAGVSTGIVYNYFHNKKEIFMACVELYAEEVGNPIYARLEQAVSKDRLVDCLDGLIDEVMEFHRNVAKAHQEMQGMAHADADVAAYFKQYEENMTLQITEILRGHGFSDPHLYEKIHIIYNLIEDLAHETVFHQHENMDHEAMKQTVIDIIKHLVAGM